MLQSIMKNVTLKRRVGFLYRMSTRDGRKILNNKRRNGRYRLTI